MGSRSARSIRCERDWWLYLNGKGRRHAIRRGKLQKRFNKWFGKGGPYEDLKLFVELAAEDVAAGKTFHPESLLSRLSQPHPEAFRFLVRFGTNYKPFRWPRPPGFGEPEREECFTNAWILAAIEHRSSQKKRNAGHAQKSSELCYVEGIAFGPEVPPMQHAWNSFGLSGNVAFDWTFYAHNHRTRYFGIALAWDELEELRQFTDRRNARLIIFHRNAFYRTGFRHRLIEILRRRKRAGKRVPRRTDKKKSRG